MIKQTHIVIDLETMGKGPNAPIAATARSVILTACSKAGLDWTTRLRLRRSTGMRPAEVGKFLDQLVSAGILEATTVYYGSETPGDKDYKGYTTGYRLAGTMKEAA